MATSSQVYVSMHSVSGTIITQSFDADQDGLHSKNHSFLEDLSKWTATLEGRPENVLLKSATREFEAGLLSAAIGQYRQAYFSLRFFLEHGLAAVYFSAHELKLRLWMIGQQDVVWNSVVSPDEGIFSTRFVTAFSPALNGEASTKMGMAQALYRECSEFVHGNFSTYRYIPDNLAFSLDTFKAWEDRAETSRLLLSFALFVRYRELLSNDPVKKNLLEATITEHLGHIEAVREFYS